MIDNTLMDQFWQYYDTNYADINLTTEQVLSQTFSQTASVFTVSEKTPTDTHSPAEKGSSTPILLIVGTVLLLMIIGIIFIILRSRKTKVSGNETKTEPDIFTQMDTERDSED